MSIRRYRWVVGLWTGMLCLTTPASAQYFGQNKVQYETFDFQVLRTANFDVYFYPEERDAVAEAARMAEAWRTRLTTTFGVALPGRQPLVMYASQPHFAQTQVIEGLIGEGTGGVTELLKRRMVLPFGSSLGETNHVIGHELVHAFQFALGGEGALALPLWFIEGMAEYLTLGQQDPHTAMWLRSLARGEKLPRLQDLDDPRYFPYRIGHGVWAFLASRYGERVVPDAFLAAASSRDALQGIQEATGEDLDALSAAWQASLRERHGSPGADAPLPGREIISGQTPRKGRLHVSPSLSPDGRWLVYLSERDVLSLDYFLVDARTGRVVRRLTTSATDPHIESLQFVTSAGGWDARSQSFAFTTIQRGRPTLTITQVNRRGATRVIPIPDVDDAWHPTWSPDGQSIAFSGQAGGVSDLYVLTVATGAVRRLTHDPWADLHPAWSPDGRHIAFVTDRFSSDMERLQFGPMRPALLVEADGRVESFPALPTGSHINPQWTREGRALVLVASPDGVANLYRLDLASGAYTRLTDVPTGISGLTTLSPAMSVATETNEYAYGVFTGGGYDLRLAALPTMGSPPPSSSGARPLFGNNSPAAQDRAGASPPLREPATVEPYRARLALDYIGASGGIGAAGNVGAFAAGGIGMQWSDTLGEHTASLLLQANGGVKDLGGQAAYINRTGRWNWGLVTQMVPYVTGLFREGVGSLDGRPVIVDETFLIRQTELQSRALVMYPFSRATRFEVQGGGRRIWFDREIHTRLFDVTSGEFLGDRKQDLGAPASLTLGDVSAGVVHDQTTFGPVGPLQGRRYRLDLTQTTGSLSYTNLVFDYRTYGSLLKPITIAIRGLHIGRYGTDADDPRLSDLYLGYPSLVRGYDVNSFDATECGSVAGACPVFDRLVGSRLLVGTAELRFPLFGLFSGEYRYGPIPIEGFLFADTGVAWTGATRPSFADGDRTFVSSVGAGARINAFGYLIVQLAGAKPLNRPGSGWRFVFDFSPSF